MYETVSSYVVHWNEGDIALYVLNGHPCSAGEYARLPIHFGQPNDLSAYPSARAVAAQ
jgi:hypothetical protein